MIDEAAISCLALAELSEQAIFSFDVHLNKFIYVNPSFRKHVQLDDDLIPNSSINLLFHPEDDEFVKVSYQELIEKEDRKKVEFRLLMPDKTVKTVRVEAFNTITDDKRQIITGIMEDITAFKEHSDTLNKFSNKKNTILNILSHDILGPLGAIQNLSTMVNRKVSISEDQELYRFVNSIKRISNNTITLIRNLLDQEFLESADAKLVLRRTNIVDAFKATIQGYKDSEDSLKRTFKFSVSKDPILVDIDETKLLQVVSNLISNAIKFTHENGVIEISIEDEQKTLLIKVSDNGIGIPKEDHASLFNKFTVARRPGLQGEPSHGLGMSIVKAIVEWHHGSIWFDSEEDVGTTFYIRIPCSS